MNTLLQNVEVLVENKPIKIFAHQNRLFIEAREGVEFQLKLKNDSYSRVLAVASVDGINVISGKDATDESPGYVISGRDSTRIKGFRVSDDKVNAFKFTKKSNSYAAKNEATDKDIRACGVIGVKFFSEKEKVKPAVIRKTEYIPYPVPTYPLVPRPPYERWVPEPVWYYGDTTNTYGDSLGELVRCANLESRVMRGMGSARSCVNSSDITFTASPSATSFNAVSVKKLPEFDMGVEFSEKEIEDKVKEVEFEMGYLLNFVEIYFASRESLEAMGVKFDKEPEISFPQSFKESKYCRPPK